MAKSREAKRDHTTFSLKLALHKRALSIAGELCEGPPFIMETHGGLGRLYAALYGLHNLRGVVFEKDPAKIGTLADQRPTWAIYEGNCEKALADGAAATWAIDLLDIDPYGDPWPTIEGFMSSDRPFTGSMVIVVTDGLRLSARLGRAWHTARLQEVVQIFGNSNLWRDYLKACELIMENVVAKAGYHVDRFAGYHCGRNKSMTHYLAVLLRSET